MIIKSAHYPENDIFNLIVQNTLSDGNSYCYYVDLYVNSVFHAKSGYQVLVPGETEDVKIISFFDDDWFTGKQLEFRLRAVKRTSVFGMFKPCPVSTGYTTMDTMFMGISGTPPLSFSESVEEIIEAVEEVVEDVIEDVVDVAEDVADKVGDVFEDVIDIGKLTPTISLPGIAFVNSTVDITGTYEPGNTLRLYIDKKLPEIDKPIKEITVLASGGYETEYTFNKSGIYKLYVSHGLLSKRSERSTIIIFSYEHVILLLAAMVMVIYKLRRK